MQDANIEFRLAEKTDRAALAQLMLEANVHYWGEAVHAKEMTSRAADALIDGQTGCRAFLAIEDGVAKGFATVSLLLPAPNEHGTLFMKDLFVSQSGRGAGLGRRFMRYLARYAVKLGCSRFDWTAEIDNPAAIAFYDDLKASRVVEKVYFRFCDAQLREFAEE